MTMMDRAEFAMLAVSFAVMKGSSLVKVPDSTVYTSLLATIGLNGWTVSVTVPGHRHLRWIDAVAHCIGESVGA